MDFSTITDVNEQVITDLTTALTNHEPISKGGWSAIYDQEPDEMLLFGKQWGVYNSAKVPFWLSLSVRYTPDVASRAIFEYSKLIVNSQLSTKYSNGESATMAMDNIEAQITYDGYFANMNKFIDDDILTLRLVSNKLKRKLQYDQDCSDINRRLVKASLANTEAVKPLYGVVDNFQTMFGIDIPDYRACIDTKVQVVNEAMKLEADRYTFALASAFSKL